MNNPANLVGVWLSLVRALRSGRKSRRFESSHPDHFFARMGKKNMKPEKASLHGTQCRFIRCSRASCTAGALHIFAFSDEAAAFHSAMKHCSVSLHNMKHSAFAPYDEKMKNESSSVCNTTMSVLYYHLRNLSQTENK